MPQIHSILFIHIYPPLKIYVTQHVLTEKSMPASANFSLFIVRLVTGKQSRSVIMVSCLLRKSLITKEKCPCVLRLNVTCRQGPHHFCWYSTTPITGQSFS